MNIPSIIAAMAVMNKKRLINAEITDSWDTIISKIESGTHNYRIGNYKPLNLGSEGVINMQLVALDKDALASGDGFAATTWISKELLATSKKMKSTATTEGGWEDSDMRAYLTDSIKPLIPDNVVAALKTVTKYSRIFDSDAPVNDVTSTEDIWIPSLREVAGETTNAETKGPVYKAVYIDGNYKSKLKTGASSPVSWWLRTAIYNNAYGSILANGSIANGAATAERGVTIGFCI